MKSKKRSFFLLFSLVQIRRQHSYRNRMLVTLQYEDLKNGKDLSEQVYAAYGPQGLGALTIRGIPNYVEYRKKLLPLAHKLASLPEDRKKLLEHEPSMYNVGWSFGKEKLGENPDYAKGSFYGNPVYDTPASSKEELEKYPWASPNNIWPTQDLPDLEKAFKNLGSLMYEVVVLLCKQIDTVVHKRLSQYKDGTMYDAIRNTRKIKGRLLYYYPQTSNPSDDSWIGWHNDSGFLTALTGEMFVDHSDGHQIKNPDPNGGLWIVDRKSGSVKVNIPEDELAIQCGECLQIVTGGILVATPHSVRASIAEPGAPSIGRSTFPVFVDTSPSFALSMPSGCNRAEIFDKSPISKVPPLEKRWTHDGQIFADFLGNTFKQYYEWSVTKK